MRPPPCSVGKPLKPILHRIYTSPGLPRSLPCASNKCPTRTTAVRRESALTTCTTTTTPRRSPSPWSSRMYSSLSAPLSSFKVRTSSACAWAAHSPRPFLARPAPSVRYSTAFASPGPQSTGHRTRHYGARSTSPSSLHLALLFPPAQPRRRRSTSLLIDCQEASSISRRFRWSPATHRQLVFLCAVLSLDPVQC